MGHALWGDMFVKVCEGSCAREARKSDLNGIASVTFGGWKWLLALVAAPLPSAWRHWLEEETGDTRQAHFSDVDDASLVYSRVTSDTLAPAHPLSRMRAFAEVGWRA